MDPDGAAGTGDVNLANALDLSESEEEEELEDLIEDFALQADEGQVCAHFILYFSYSDVRISRILTFGKKDCISSNFLHHFQHLFRSSRHRQTRLQSMLMSRARAATHKAPRRRSLSLLT